MITFESYDLIYMDYEEKTTTKPLGSNKTYRILRFLDRHTKRAVFIYDWSGRIQDHIALLLEKGGRYYVKGYINTSGHQTWLVITGVGRLEKGRAIINPYNEEEGIAEIEATPPY